MQMTASQHWVWHQKVKEQEGYQRLLGEEWLKREKQGSWEVAKAVTGNRKYWSESVTVLCAWRDKI